MVIGIDPGKIVTIAKFYDDNIETVKFDISNRNPMFYDYIKSIARYYKNISIFDSKEDIYIENVHSMPFDSRKSSFTFGKSFGTILTALEMANLHYTLVDSKRWRKYTNTHTKEDSINYVKNKYPNINLLATLKSKKEDHNIADAICILEYGIYKKTSYYTDNEKNK